MMYASILVAIFFCSFLQACFCEDQDRLTKLEQKVEILFDQFEALTEQLEARFGDEEPKMPLETEIIPKNGTLEERVTLLELRVGDLTGDLEAVDDDVTLIASEQILQDQKILELEIDADGFEESIESLIATDISVNQELESLAATDASFNSTLIDLEDRIQQQEVSGTFAFQAAILENTIIPLDSPVVFDDVILNIGNGYNGETGEFTVPSGGAGLYFFYVSFFGANGKYMHFELRVNSVEMCTAGGDMDNSPVDNSTPSCGAVVVLEEGDIVDVYYDGGTDDTPTDGNARRWHSFTGFRIAQGSL